MRVGPWFGVLPFLTLCAARVYSTSAGAARLPSKFVMKDLANAGPATPSEPRGGSGEMFDAIAPRYDLLNRLLSLGIDQRWRRLLVRELALKPGARVLDHATGTADLAILIARTHPDSQVVGVDPSTEMLRVGRAKVEAAGLGARVSLQTG